MSKSIRIGGGSESVVRETGLIPARIGGGTAGIDGGTSIISLKGISKGRVWIPIAAAACLLAACTTGQNALVTAGVAPDKAAAIATDTAEAGQLFCQAGPVLLAVAGVNVTNASAAAVAQACAAAKVIGALTPPTTPPVPVAAPAGAQALLADVPNAVAATVAVSAIVNKPNG